MTFAKYPVTGGGGGGSGDVVGPASSTNGAIALWNGTTGKLLQDSAILSSSLVLTSGAQSIAGVKTFSNEPSAPTIALTATSNQMSFGSGPNKITVSVANNPAANLTYSIPNIAAVSLTGTFCLLEGANQTFSGTGTIFSQTVRFDASTPLWLGSSPNRVILSPGSQASPRTWLFPDLSVDPTFAALEGTQSFSGNKTFAGTLTVPGSVNYTSAGSITKSGAGALTITNASTAGLTFAGTGTVTAPTGTYTLAGLSLSNVFTVAQTITATSNQIVLHSGVNQLTLNSSTSAAARVYSFPDVGITGTVAMLEGAQTFSALKTFSSGLNVSGGSAANGSIWFASNVLRQRGGTSGWAVDNTSGTAIISATDAGALTVGPSISGNTTTGIPMVLRGMLSVDTTAVTDTAKTLYLNANAYITSGAAQYARNSNGGTLGGGMLLISARADNTSNTFRFFANNIADSDTTAATEIGGASSAGAWTFPLIHNITTGNLNSGRYTPTVTAGTSGGTNISANGTPASSIYCRVGNVVTVTARVVGVSTTAGAPTLSIMRISIPIASNLTADTDLSGTGTYIRGTATLNGNPIFVRGSVAGDDAELIWNSSSTAASDINVTFQYEVK